jgi:hypothetical protein
MLSGPRAGLDTVEKNKFWALPGLELRPLGRSAVQPVASRYADCAIPTPSSMNWSFKFFVFLSGLSDIRINCNRISEGLIYFFEDFTAMIMKNCDFRLYR